jgi:glyoxylase-like metal-dependent hydrolase (beta-lactamase superfamily II)
LIIPSFSFLIERESGQKVLFDLGIREDWRNLPSEVVGLLDSHDWAVRTGQNTSTILDESGVNTKDGAIAAVIWSHTHFDHIGDIAAFPRTTKLVVGKDFRRTATPGRRVSPAPILSDHDFQGREVEEVNFSQAQVRIGRFAAYDYFGDGSFYLLDTPGHAVGHMSALARTSASPPSFVLMVGDASHHAGELRPSVSVPLADEINPSPVPEIFSPGCPSHLFLSINPLKSKVEPFYKLTEQLNYDVSLANSTISGLQELDGEDNVLVLTAHDSTALENIAFFPDSINDWLRHDWKNQLRWKFLRSFKQELPDVQ